MTKKSPRKRTALKVLSIVLCLAVFIGATYAWFSDEAKTGEVTITAGNLDVDIVDANDSTKSLEGEKLFDTSKVNMENWEPGMMVISDEFKIANKGTLAFQYKVSVDVTTTEATEEKDKLDLLDRIKYKVVEVPDKNTLPDADSDLQARLNFWNGIKDDADKTIGKMKATDKVSENPLVIVLFWEPDQSTADDNADNRYNIKDNYQSSKLTATFKVNVFATQTPEESDSFGNKYDGQVFLPGQEEAEIAKMDEYMKGQDYLFRSGDDITETLAGKNYKGGPLDPDKKKNADPFSAADRKGTPLYLLGDYDAGGNGTGALATLPSSSESIVVDLNGYKITAGLVGSDVTPSPKQRGSYSIRNGLIQLKMNYQYVKLYYLTKIAFSNLKISREDNPGENILTCFSKPESGEASINLNNLNVNGGKSELYVNDNGLIDINGSTFSNPNGNSSRCALFISGGNEVKTTIKGTTIDGYAELQRSGTTEISDCVFTRDLKITDTQRDVPKMSLVLKDTVIEGNFRTSIIVTDSKPAKMTFENVTIKGNDSSSFWGADINVISGTFGFDPESVGTMRIALGSQVTKNHDGTWTVKAATN